jgi:hypothetical protein
VTERAAAAAPAQVQEMAEREDGQDLDGLVVTNPFALANAELP